MSVFFFRRVSIAYEAYQDQDGKLSTTRLSPGKHLIWVTCDDQEHGLLGEHVGAARSQQNRKEKREEDAH
jgi:hypothetical protein